MAGSVRSGIRLLWWVRRGIRPSEFPACVACVRRPQPSMHTTRLASNRRGQRAYCQPSSACPHAMISSTLGSPCTCVPLSKPNFSHALRSYVVPQFTCGVTDEYRWLSPSVTANVAGCPGTCMSGWTCLPPCGTHLVRVTTREERIHRVGRRQDTRVVEVPWPSTL